MLKYKLFGKAVKSRNKAKLVRQSITETLLLQGQVSHMDLHDIAVKEAVLHQRRKELMETAKIMVESCGNPREMVPLKELYRQIKMNDIEYSMLSRMRESLLSSKVAREETMTTMLVEKQIIEEHTQRKIRKMIGPSHRSLGLKATKNQIEREQETDMRRDLILEEEEKDEDSDKEDMGYHMWLDSIVAKPALVGESKCDSSNRGDLEKRILDMKQSK